MTTGIRDQQEKPSLTFRILAGLITENTLFVRNARTESERLSVFDTNPPSPDKTRAVEQSRLAHAGTLGNMRNDFAKLSDAEKGRFRELFDQRRALLVALQPKDERTKDPDEKENVLKLKDLNYLGEVLGFEKPTQ